MGKIARYISVQRVGEGRGEGDGGCTFSRPQLCISLLFFWRLGCFWGNTLGLYICSLSLLSRLCSFVHFCLLKTQSTVSWKYGGHQRGGLPPARKPRSRAGPSRCFSSLLSAYYVDLPFRRVLCFGSLVMSKQLMKLFFPLKDVMIASLLQPMSDRFGRLQRSHSSSGYLAMMG